jgi:ADP-dependent NAD(P)H-hydrate dehydratase / NAD(P)H-hydrate epimerase
VSVAYEVAEIRAAEGAAREALPPGTLMRRAAAGLSVVVGQLLADSGNRYGRRVAVLVGPGDNGGDALYAAASLARRGVQVDAVTMLPGRGHAGGLAALRLARGRVHDSPGESAAHAVLSADVVLDGIAGIGGRGGVSGVIRDYLELARGRLVAVDVPTGLVSDTGEGDTVPAEVTVTFGCFKPALFLRPEIAGVVRFVDIGLADFLSSPPPLTALGAAEVGRCIPRPSSADHKYSRGVLGVAAGSAAYPGAAVLAVGAALRTGIGMVRYTGSAAAAVLARWPEVVIGDVGGDARVTAWLVGPGLGSGADAETCLGSVLAQSVPVVVDADALTLLGRNPTLMADRGAPTVLTPHHGELDRLMESLPPSFPAAVPMVAARSVARWLGAVVALKGHRTLIATPRDGTYVNMTGTPWLATAGTGDVLAGVIGALLAGGVPAARAAASGAWIHGLAGRLAAAEHPISASDLWETIGEAMALALHHSVGSTPRCISHVELGDCRA